MIKPDDLLMMLAEQEATIERQAKLIKALATELAMVLAGEV